MLRDDVVETVEAGRFSIFPVETIDQGTEIQSGVPAGEANAEGDYADSAENIFRSSHSG